ncbi:MAG: hypothetical protein ABJA83_00650 [Burkholderiaceae bacterium]
MWLLLESQGYARHRIIMLVDGNDARRIDIGMTTRDPLVGMRSNVHRLSSSGNPIFPRDSIEFHMTSESRTSSRWSAIISQARAVTRAVASASSRRVKW